MKTVLCTLLLATLSALAAKADVTIVFDQPDQIAGPGDTLQFFGTITNDDSEHPVYLNSDDPTLNGASLTINDLFFDNVPASLLPVGPQAILSFSTSSSVTHCLMRLGRTWEVHPDRG